MIHKHVSKSLVDFHVMSINFQGADHVLRNNLRNSTLRKRNQNTYVKFKYFRHFN